MSSNLAVLFIRLQEFYTVQMKCRTKGREVSFILQILQIALTWYRISTACYYVCTTSVNIRTYSKPRVIRANSLFRDIKDNEAKCEYLLKEQCYSETDSCMGTRIRRDRN